MEFKQNILMHAVCCGSWLYWCNLVNADLALLPLYGIAAQGWSWSKILFALAKAVKLQASFIYVTDSWSKGGLNLMLASDRIQGWA